LLAGSTTFDARSAAPVSCLIDGQDANPSTTKQPEPQTPVNYITDSS
jgi:hypothetical protein